MPCSVTPTQFEKLSAEFMLAFQMLAAEMLLSIQRVGVPEKTAISPGLNTIHEDRVASQQAN
jgi:hypothetical protein